MLLFLRDYNGPNKFCFWLVLARRVRHLSRESTADRLSPKPATRSEWNTVKYGIITSPNAYCTTIGVMSQTTKTLSADHRSPSALPQTPGRCCAPLTAPRHTTKERGTTKSSVWNTFAFQSSASLSPPVTVHMDRACIWRVAHRIWAQQPGVCSRRNTNPRTTARLGEAPIICW